MLIFYKRIHYTEDRKSYIIYYIITAKAKRIGSRLWEKKTALLKKNTYTIFDRHGAAAL